MGTGLGVLIWLDWCTKFRILRRFAWAGLGWGAEPVSGPARDTQWWWDGERGDRGAVPELESSCQVKVGGPERAPRGSFHTTLLIPAAAHQGCPGAQAARHRFGERTQLLALPL